MLLCHYDNSIAVNHCDNEKKMVTNSYIMFKLQCSQQRIKLLLLLFCSNWWLLSITVNSDYL